MKFCSDKNIDRLISLILKEGWRLVSKGRHIRLFSPNGIDIMTIAKTPSDHRAFDNVRACARRLGCAAACA